MTGMEAFRKWRPAIEWLEQSTDSEVERDLLALHDDTRAQLNLLLATAALCERRQ